MKSVVISVGPIPARLDSVKFLTNRFKGGLAIKTARNIIGAGFPTTIVKWKYTELPASDYWENQHVKIVDVQDVIEYYNWFDQNAANYDAFVMAAAVANLMPAKPLKGKFPSHKYQVGEEFDIKFKIAPRAIDIIKKRNPRACLIGYKLFDGSEEELIAAARETQAASKANIIFANHPNTASMRKLAVMPDGAVIPCVFDEHIALIKKAINAEYFRTVIQPLTEEEIRDPDIREAFATVKMFERTFDKFGTVAIPVAKHDGMFATTSRGHQAGPVLVRGVDYDDCIVYASGKATLNAPTLNRLLDLNGDQHIIVHRHSDDPRYYDNRQAKIRFRTRSMQHYGYEFPGTLREADTCAMDFIEYPGCDRLILPYHGDITILPIESINWEEYYDLFPAKYFTSPAEIDEAVQKFNDAHKRTIEFGCNNKTDCTFGYDTFVDIENIPNDRQLCWHDVMAHHFDLGVMRNAINYFNPYELKVILDSCDTFIANTFLIPPEEKISDGEAVIHVEPNTIRHTLLTGQDSIMRHEFYAYDQSFYESLGLTVKPYGKNSALVCKNI